MTSHLVRWPVSLIVIVAVAAPLPARPAEVATTSLSGAAMNALVAGYKTLKFGSLRDAPLLLQDKMVEISQFNGSFIVRIGEPPTKDVQRVVVDIKSGDIISDTPPGEVHFGGAVPLPGFIAGEFIAAYDFALSGKTLAPLGLSLLRQGSYYAKIDSGFNGADVAFIALRETPNPGEPMLRPNETCVQLFCPDQIELLNVEVSNGKVNIDPLFSVNGK